MTTSSSSTSHLTHVTQPAAQNNQRNNNKNRPPVNPIGTLAGHVIPNTQRTAKNPPQTNGHQHGVRELPGSKIKFST